MTPKHSDNLSHASLHAHGAAHKKLSVASQATVRITLMAIVVPLALATLLGLFLLWPTDTTRISSVPTQSENSVEVKVEVTEVEARTCVAPDIAAGSLMEDAVCARVVEGPAVDTIVPVHVPPETRVNLKPGDVMRTLMITDAAAPEGIYIFWDMVRSSPMLILIAIYVIVVIAVARVRGLAAIGGLLASVLVLVFFLVPALMSGESPLLVTLVGVGAMMFLSVYLAHGISIRTTTALLGTSFGLLLTVGLAAWTTDSLRLFGSGEETTMVVSSFPEVSMPAIILCGIVLAGLGALNDVAITQASAVWELYSADPDSSRWTLFSRAMRIGRDHIASTVYTLAFAYAGTALPMLMLVMLQDRGAFDLLGSGGIAEEIARTLVASIGLILAIPATTAIGAILVGVADRAGSRQDREL